MHKHTTLSHGQQPRHNEISHDPTQVF